MTSQPAANRSSRLRNIACIRQLFIYLFIYLLIGPGDAFSMGSPESESGVFEWPTAEWSFGSRQLSASSGSYFDLRSVITIYMYGEISVVERMCLRLVAPW